LLWRLPHWWWACTPRCDTAAVKHSIRSRTVLNPKQSSLKVGRHLQEVIVDVDRTTFVRFCRDGNMRGTFGAIADSVKEPALGSLTVMATGPYCRRTEARGAARLC
jgi:hypothetical protein